MSKFKIKRPNAKATFDQEFYLNESIQKHSRDAERLGLKGRNAFELGLTRAQASQAIDELKKGYNPFAKPLPFIPNDRDKKIVKTTTTKENVMTFDDYEDAVTFCEEKGISDDFTVVNKFKTFGGYALSQNGDYPEIGNDVFGELRPWLSI